MNLDLDEIAGLNEKLLGIDTRTEAGKQEMRELAFVEDAISEDDAIESMYYPYGRPSKWDLFYDKWFALDLTKTGGSPSYFMMLTWVLSAPFVWVYNKRKKL